MTENKRSLRKFKFLYQFSAKRLNRNQRVFFAEFSSNFVNFRMEFVEKILHSSKQSSRSQRTFIIWPQILYPMFFTLFMPLIILMWPEAFWMIHTNVCLNSITDRVQIILHSYSPEPMIPYQFISMSLCYSYIEDSCMNHLSWLSFQIHTQVPSQNPFKLIPLLIRQNPYQFHHTFYRAVSWIQLQIHYSG